MDVHGAAIQILDLPGIIEGAKDGKGRGRQVIAGTSFPPPKCPGLHRLSPTHG